MNHLTLTADFGAVLVDVEMKDISEMPRAIMEMCAALGMPISNITFRLEPKGTWLGVEGTNGAS